jgi:hypothetical protein
MLNTYLNLTDSNTTADLLTRQMNMLRPVTVDIFQTTIIAFALFQNAAPCFDRSHLTGQRIAEESAPWTICSRCHHYHNGSGFCG